MKEKDGDILLFHVFDLDLLTISFISDSELVNLFIDN